MADDRSYETWYERVSTRLEPVQTHVLYLLSDRAKALIKLAKTGLECPSIPDLFQGGPFDATCFMTWPTGTRCRYGAS